MDVTVLGAAGPTGLWIVREALRAGHDVRAVSRRDDPLPLPPHDRLTQVRADAQSGEGIEEAVAGADAVLSSLGVAYTRHEITIFSQGTRTVVDALRATGRGRRLVVVSSGLTYPPTPLHPIADRTILPLLRHVIGRTLYADMRRMEGLLRESPDIAWTVMRPGRLVDADAVSDYRLDIGAPSRGTTTRPDLAAAMVAELDDDAHVHQAVAPTSDRPRR
ncbi:NAD(P)-dependent oxidoreductase [Brachybacterium sp. NPDC056505]|uniref:NAD(P)-dependent oxidoreductase n=1 Tax=Brachybacterium sp. NPDC056505 TaxID=3345843 RepID=UPI0036728F99